MVLPFKLSPAYTHPRLRSSALIGLTLVICLSIFTYVTISIVQAQTQVSCPQEQPITVPDVEKKLIRKGPNRSGQCLRPDLIFIHATGGGTLDSNWHWFDSGAAAQGKYVNAQFIVGTDGKIYQTVELYQNMVEHAITNTPMNHRSIGIELVHTSAIFSGKEEVPPAQYNAALKLVGYLMNQYNIPLGQNEADWVLNPCFDANNPQWTPGVYAHYQIGTCAHQDPGKQMFAAFREDLRSGGFATNAPASGGGGRIVPYDAFARPYSWPTTGTIRQPYGFTSEAQNLGSRYTNYYPLGDPGAIFSTTNHVEPPLDPTKAQYINPNIDIAPADDSTAARAVYATHAGWITYAGWAGINNGYTIQIESDVEGDGQSDMATRYMRLQPPTDGFFAPDIAEYYPDTQPQTNPTEQNPVPLQRTVPPMTTVEAEHFDLDNPDQAAIVSDIPRSSHGQSVRLTGTAPIRTQNTNKADKLVIAARAPQCGFGIASISAQMIVALNNQELERITVSSDIWQSYTINLPTPLDGSPNFVSLQLANPIPLCISLWIDSVSYMVTNPNTPTIEELSKSVIEAENITDVTEGDKPTSIVNDVHASGRRYVAFTSPSKIEDQVMLASFNYMTITARADLCGEESPQLKVTLDDQELRTLGVNQSGWFSYTMDLNPATSDTSQTTTTTPAPTTPSTPSDTNSEDEDSPTTAHTISLEFTNDQFIPGLCDRNVYVDKIEFIEYQTTQTTYSPTSLIGKTKYVGYNQLIGYVSTSRGGELEWQAYKESNLIDYAALLPQGSPDELARQEALDSQTFAGLTPNANQTYLSYRIMYNNPNLTTFPLPSHPDLFINAKVDDPYIVESNDNKIAGSLRTILDDPNSPLYFFCAYRQRGDQVQCINERNP